MIQMNCMYRTLLATVAVAVSSVTASAETIVVPIGGDIQAAIDSATAGDTIQLEAGTYEIDDTLQVSIPITIAGAAEVDSKGSSVIDAGRRCRIIRAQAELELRFLVLKDGMAGFPSAFTDDEEQGDFDPDGDPCEFEPADDGNDDGGGIYASDTLIMYGCEVVGCRASSWGGGVYARGNATLVDCVLRDNAAASGGGLWFNEYWADVELSVTGCVFEDLSACSGAVFFIAFGSVLMEDCTVIDCRGNALFRLRVVGLPFEIKSSLICDNNQCGLDYGAFRYRLDEDSCICSSLADLNADGIPDDCEGQDHTIASLVHDAIDAGETAVQLPPGRFELAAPISTGFLDLESELTIRGAPDGGTELSGRGVIPLVLVSQGPCRIADVELIDGFGDFGGAVASFFSGSAGITLEDVAVRNCSARLGGGMSTYSSPVEFDGVVFSDCAAADGNALKVERIQVGNSMLIVDAEFDVGDVPGDVVAVQVIGEPGDPYEVLDFEVHNCRWTLGTNPDSSAIRVDLPDEIISSFGRLEGCEFFYPEERQRIIRGRQIWRAVDCSFSSCCPFDSVTSTNLAEESGNLWRCDSCPGDVTCDAMVNARDLGRLLSAWDTTQQRYDRNQDGIVDAADLGLLLGSWGVCE
ncbi:right-handed parallel beta-helix repeat-containing protein [bacterium]|nr:right-handed parallel beta-helix repeat-containing protein [bacterium]